MSSKSFLYTPSQTFFMKVNPTIQTPSKILLILDKGSASVQLQKLKYVTCPNGHCRPQHSIWSVTAPEVFNYCLHGRDNSSNLLPNENLLPLTSMTQEMQYAWFDQLKQCIYISLNSDCPASIAMLQLQLFYCCLAVKVPSHTEKQLASFRKYDGTQRRI